MFFLNNCSFLNMISLALAMWSFYLRRLLLGLFPGISSTTRFCPGPVLGHHFFHDTLCPLSNLIYFGNLSCPDYADDFQIFIFSLNLSSEPQPQDSSHLDTFIWMSQGHLKFSISEYLSSKEPFLD